jgi:hypothetical protein
VRESERKRRERTAWLLVALWSLGIFLAIPLARTIEGFVRDNLGQASFGWFVLCVVALATALAARAVVVRSRASNQSPLSALLWLCTIGLVFGAATVSLWKNPEEAMHFVQYGVLGMWLHRALRFRLTDASLYVVAAVVGTCIGCLDEAIQWVTPERYFGLRDIVLNASASALVQIGIAKGLAPADVDRGFSPAGVRACCRAGAVLLALVLLFTLNTPPRTARWTAWIPGLAFLAHNESTMMEYGFRYDEPGIGVFRSRLRLDELIAVDRVRAGADAERLGSCLTEYREFILALPPSRDAFLHELCVHLFRRDRYHFLSDRAQRDDELERRKLATVAVREERIARAYFGVTLEAAGLAISASEFEHLEALELSDLAYESTVSRDLVTAVTEPQLLAGFVIGFGVLALLDRQKGRRGASSRAV